MILRRQIGKSKIHRQADRYTQTDKKIDIDRRQIHGQADRQTDR
jgi:hypothetical protein